MVVRALHNSIAINLMPPAPPISNAPPIINFRSQQPTNILHNRRSQQPTNIFNNQPTL
jgi:hypothetical protein